jgi:hypothetical protein
MRELNIPNVTLIAAVAGWFFQMGAQLFALVVLVGTIVSAPPRSFAIFQGEYGYDSSAFWESAPPIVFALFIIALIRNWKTQRRNLMLFALAVFVVQALLMMLVVEPDFTEMKATGFRDEIDPVLQSRAARWYALDWLGWAIGAVGGIALLLVLVRPGTTPTQVAADNS